MTNNDKTIGLDVGGTKILLEVFDRNFKVLHRVKVLTEVQKGKQGFLDQVYGLIDRFFDASVRGIGIAVPGIVDIHKGTLVHAPHLPTRKNCPLGRLIKKRYNVLVHVDNDVNAFLAAASQSKRLKKYRNLVAVMSGTGVGGAVIADGKMIYGAKGFAGEVGHMMIRADGKLKTLEQNTGGFFIPQIAQELGIKRKMTAYDLSSGSPEARKVVAHLIKQFAIGLSGLNLIFNPEAFVLGGSIYYLFISKGKREIKKIIAERSLDGRAPELIAMDKKTSAAEGVARLLSSYSNSNS